MLPGFTITPMTDIIPDKVKEYFKSVIPLNRFAESEGNHWNTYITLIIIYMGYIIIIIPILI